MITKNSSVVLNNNNVWTRVGILTMRYGDDLGYLFVPIKQSNAEIEEIIEEATSVGMGC